MSVRIIIIIIIMIFINVTCYSEKKRSVRNSPTHGGFTSHWVYISRAMQGGCVYYKTFMEQKLVRMSERFTMNVHTVNII